MKRPSIWRSTLAFFVLAAVLSWAAWLPRAFDSHVSPYLHLVGGLGPLVAALVVSAGSEGKTGLARLLRRLIPTRAALPWLAVGAVGPVALFGVATLASLAFRCGATDWSVVARSPEFPDLDRFSYVAANLVFYGFGEEVGWRGFALPRLQKEKTALTAALIVGVAWSLWHLPLFAFAPGFSSMGIGGALGWLVSMFTGSILMAWLFNESRGSVLAVALFHASLDVSMSAPVNRCVSMVMGASVTIAGLAIPRLLGPTNLARASRVVDE